MKRISLILIFLLSAAPAFASKSYICRADGSIYAFDDGQETQVVKPLRQNEVEEMPNPAANPSTTASATASAETTPRPTTVNPNKSDLVPLTQKDIQDRGQ